ncbi:MAG TPA: complex I NDUFA9 subunit family protein [Patescibacteria group bacterium]|nr:complex I NDUFA9 subunit family protein [Patescibacteria group bacterium]
MSVQGEITTIFGGTGFIGRHIVRRLAKAGHTVKVATRVPECAYFLRPYGKVGQIVPVACDYSDAGIAAAVAGATNVINCVGILYEKRKSTFQKIHAELPGRIAAASREAGAKRLVHISALGVDQGTSRYHKSKIVGEEAVKKEFPPATILRPSIVFGAEDNFFNKFASIAAIAPALPLIGGGKTKFQPVFVGDVADAAMASLTSDAAKGKTYELGGPETVDFRQIYQRLFDCTQQPRMLISLPWGLAKFKATFLGLLPHPPLTTDQVESLKTDSVVHAGALSLHDLGIGPTGMSLILPEYLDYRRRGGAFAVQGHG